MFQCCSYKSARRGMLLMNMIMLVFAIVFLGVGAVSLAYGQGFATTANNYCFKICGITDADQVACNCDVSPPQTTLPVLAFQAPASGLIVVGVFAIITSILGCVGAIREKSPIIIAYIILLLIVIIIQFGFGTAAIAVASGSAPQISGPFLGVLNENYKYFDWKMLNVFFPSACYYAHSNVTIVDIFTNTPLNMTFNYPACDFYGKCAGWYAQTYTMSKEEKYCCSTTKKTCDTSKVDCMSGNDCVMSFLSKAAAPIAIVAFLALSVEITALVYACIIRPGKSGGKTV